MHKTTERNTSQRQSGPKEQSGGPGVAVAVKPTPYKKPRLCDVKDELTCILCNGYFIDATTICECLHSFCKSCIVKYLQTNKCCPICETPVQTTKQFLSLRSDKMLQDIVYKLIPDVFKCEMQRRREFYDKNTEALPTCAEDRGELVDHRVFYMADDKISLSLEYGYGDNQTPDNALNANNDDTKMSDKLINESDAMKRYLLCPAGLSVLHLKKFIVRKYGLPTTYRVDVMYLEDILSDDITLMDVAYIYDWKRSDPMRLFYRISERPIKRLKTTHPQTIDSKSGSGSSVSSTNSDTSNANNHNHNNNNNGSSGGASVSQSKLVGAHPASSRSSNNSTSTIIMTGAAPVPTSSALKAHNSSNTSNNSSANGVTSTKGSTVTPKHADTSVGAAQPNTPQAVLKTKSTHLNTSANAIQTDEPPKKLRKILPANNSTLSTPKPVPISKANCANTTTASASVTLPSNATTTTTVNTLRQCRINTDKSKVCSSSVGPIANNTYKTEPNAAITVGLSANSSTKEDMKDKKDTKCVNPCVDSEATKRNTSRKSSAFDVRTLIGTKSPTLSCNSNTKFLSESEFTEAHNLKGIHHKSNTSDVNIASQGVKQSKSREAVNRNRLTTSQSLISSTSSSITGITSNNAKHESIAPSRPHTKITPIDKGSDNSNKISTKPIGGPKSESTAMQRQSNPLSPPPIRIRLHTEQSTSTNKSCAKPTAYTLAPEVQTNSKYKDQKSNQSMTVFDSKKQLSDSKITTTTVDKPHNVCNHSVSKSGISQSSSKTKGASINQIVSKIASGVTAKSASVNVTSTAPTLQLTNNSTSSTTFTSSSHAVTPNDVNDDKVNTTTGESGIGSVSASQQHRHRDNRDSNQCQSESAIKSVSSSATNSGNLVIRISTKTHSVESLVSPKDKSAQQKINNKCDTKRDFINSSTSSSKSSLNASDTTPTHMDCKTTKTSANESLNDIKEKIGKKESEIKCLDSSRVNSNDEEDDDEDDMKLVVDVPNEDSCENDLKDKSDDRHSIRSQSNQMSVRSESSSLLVKTRVPSDISTKLAISISSGTTLSANCAVLTSPPPTPTPSPKSESDPCVTSDTKPNSSTNGPLDLSMSTKKDRQPKPSAAPIRAIYDIPPSKPKQCVNPAVLDKHRGLFSSTSQPKQQFPSFRIMNTQSNSGSSQQTHKSESKKSRSISSPVVSSNTTTGSHPTLNSTSRHRSVSHNHHSSSHHNHNQKNYSVITPDPRRYTPKIVIRNIGSPPSITSHFNYPTHH